MDRDRIFTSIGIAAIILLVFGLGGWYFFLRTQTNTIQGEAGARGFSIGIPSFLGTRGSNSANTSGPGAAAQEFTSGSSGSAFTRLIGFGEPLEGEKVRGDSAANTGGAASEKRAPRFWRVSSSPVAGAAFTNDSSVQLRYVERATGNVFDANPRTGDVVRVTNTLTPRVYDAVVGNGIVIERTVEDNIPATLSGKVGSTTDGSPGELSLVNLGKDVRDIVVAPKDIVLIAHTDSSDRLVRSAWDGGNPKQLLSIPGGDFRIQLVDNDIILTERTGSGIPGSAFRATVPLTPLIRNVLGLALKVQAGTGNVLFSSDDGTRLRLYTKLGTGSPTEISQATSVEKCVWAPTGKEAYCAIPQDAIPPLFHDRWYRGEIHTNDMWYAIDTSAGKVEPLFKIDSASAIDVENPVIDRNGDYLAFVNARDKSLWVLRIKE